MSFISEQLEAKIGRRNLLQIGAASGAALLSGGLLSGCGGHYNRNDNGGSTGGGTDLATIVSTLNFALNLEYLESEFYLRATGLGTGTANGLRDVDITGAGTQGTVNGGGTLTFSSPTIGSLAQELAIDELSHVQALRSTISSLGGTPVSRPAIDYTGAFTTIGTALGRTFSPFTNQNDFLLAAYLFEDVGVTAYKGSAGNLVSNLGVLTAAAGILAVEAYHAGAIRTHIALNGLATESDALSDSRDTADNTGEAGVVADDDQGVGQVNANPTPPGANAPSSTFNIVPTDANALAFSRTPTQVLRIVYLDLNGDATTNPGGFFPNGVNVAS